MSKSRLGSWMINQKSVQKGNWMINQKSVQKNIIFHIFYVQTQPRELNDKLEKLKKNIVFHIFYVQILPRELSDKPRPSTEKHPPGHPSKTRQNKWEQRKSANQGSGGNLSAKASHGPMIRRWFADSSLPGSTGTVEKIRKIMRFNEKRRNPSKN